MEDCSGRWSITLPSALRELWPLMPGTLGSAVQVEPLSSEMKPMFFLVSTPFG